MYVLEVKRHIAQKLTEGYKDEVEKFLTEVANPYERCLEYLNKWMKQLEEFSCFKWMSLSEIPSWGDVEPCVEYLISRGIHIDHAKCFDQVCNFKMFVECCLSDEELTNCTANA